MAERNAQNPSQGACQHAGNVWQSASHNLQSTIDSFGKGLMQLVQLPGTSLQRLQQQSAIKLQPLLPGIASISLSAPTGIRRKQQQQQQQQQAASLPDIQSPPRRKAQAVGDVAFNPEDIKARLSGVPVFAVINHQDEFVLISGEAEGDEAPRSMGLFFFNRADATRLVEKVQEADAKLGKTSKVMEVGMDSVYHFATAPRSDTGTEGIIFRFMPDAAQIDAAVQLYRKAGISADGFTGVPVFQAVGLTVKTGTAEYTPLFLNKADLDAAISTADAQKPQADKDSTASKMKRAQEELEQATEELAGASKNKRKAVQSRVDDAKLRFDRYTERLANGDKPKVEVGCLEEVLVRMENDEDEWGQVMFVPSGALTQPVAPDAETPVVASKGSK